MWLGVPSNDVPVVCSPLGLLWLPRCFPAARGKTSSVRNGTLDAESGSLYRLSQTEIETDAMYLLDADAAGGGKGALPVNANVGDRNRSFYNLSDRRVFGSFGETHWSCFVSCGGVDRW